jgi:hypothetical protein
VLAASRLPLCENVLESVVDKPETRAFLLAGKLRREQKKQTYRTGALTVSGINPHKGAKIMSTVLMIILVLLLVGALPSWPYSSGWGYYPAGGLGLILLITLVVVLFSGRTV